MKKRTIQILSMLLVFTLFSVNVNAQKKKKKKGKKKEVVEEKLVLANEIDSISYAVGFNMGQSIKKEFSEANLEALLAGLKDVVSDSACAIVEADMQQMVAKYFQAKQAKTQAEAAAKTEADSKELRASGEKFMAENKNKPGVITTASGLQYIVLKEGTGKQPTATSNVKVHYHGTTPDGTVFDSSVDRGEPISFGLNQVIKGWTEGVALMKEGAKYRFFIPQELAYGANAPQGGQGPIKAYMPLVFEVELIQINE